jgi:hypothetical protein
MKSSQRGRKALHPSVINGAQDADVATRFVIPEYLHLNLIPTPRRRGPLPPDPFLIDHLDEDCYPEVGDGICLADENKTMLTAGSQDAVPCFAKPIYFAGH